MIRISAPKTPISKREQLQKSGSGFSLVEILIVIGLIGLIMSLYLTDFGGALRMNISNASREIATIVRETHDEAILKGQVYRVAFDIDKGTYWVEMGERDFLMRTEEQQNEENKKNEHRSAEEKEKSKEPFQLATTVTRRKLTLPRGVKFSDIQTSRSSEPAKDGVVYAYVFPHGFIEKLIVHLEDRQERKNTLAVNSVTGKSRLFEHYEKEPY